MYSHGLLAPMVALVAWSLVMWVWLYATRLPAMVRLRVPPSAGRFARDLGPRMPPHARQAADNYNHLMEQPTIFYAICVALQLLGQGDHSLNIGLAWAYVALRVVHSLVQATVNHVPTRFTVFLLSTLCLVGLTVHAILAMSISSAHAAAPEARAWPTQESYCTLRDFRFGSGETLPELRLRYLTLGTPRTDAQGRTTNAVLLLHGTGGDATSLLNPLFSNELFGPGQPLDVTRWFVILPDDIGHGRSSKPSDGLRMRFPRYDYDDMVRSQHRMLVEHLKVDRLRLILGTSMGCMQAYVWGTTYPGFADALLPLACLPTAIAGRNRMMRWMAIEAIRRDPAWQGGNYERQPEQGLRTANEMLLIMGSSPLQMQKAAPTREQAERYVDDYLARRMASTDANDLLYQLDASRNYDPSAALAKIRVPVRHVNSADDYVNPPELGIAEELVKRMPRARFVLLPIGPDTRGHGTHTHAALWKQHLVELLRESDAAPRP